VDPAGSGLVPMVLSGWTAHEDAMPCEGTLTRGDEIRVARECWDDDLNGLVSDKETRFFPENLVSVLLNSSRSASRSAAAGTYSLVKRMAPWRQTS